MFAEKILLIKMNVPFIVKGHTLLVVFKNKTLLKNKFFKNNLIGHWKCLHMNLDNF